MIRKILSLFRRRKPNPAWRFVAFQIIETTRSLKR
jgi:hypothetical protein